MQTQSDGRVKVVCVLTVKVAADAEPRGAGSGRGAALDGALGRRVAGAVPARRRRDARSVREADDREEREDAAAPRFLLLVYGTAIEMGYN